MGTRDTRYKLTGFIELDDSYFGSSRSGKRGRGADGKTPVLIGVSVGEKGPIHASMRVLEGVKAEQIKEVASQTINAGSSVRTDGLNSYRSGLSGFEHDRMVLGSGPAASEKLPWVHILIANVKGMLRGVHHGVSPDHLQPYISEFCCRFSRRHCQGELFDRLLWACITGGDPLTWAQLVGTS